MGTTVATVLLFLLGSLTILHARVFQPWAETTEAQSTASLPSTPFEGTIGPVSQPWSGTTEASQSTASLPSTPSEGTIGPAAQSTASLPATSNEGTTGPVSQVSANSTEVSQLSANSTEAAQSTASLSSTFNEGTTGPATQSTASLSSTSNEGTTVPGEYPAVRLVDGWSPCAGRVELYNHGIWQPACTYQWGVNEAQSVCHMLNCGELISIPSANCLDYGRCQSYCPSNGGNGPTNSRCEEAATICSDALTTTDCPPGNETITPITVTGTVTGEYPVVRLVDGWSPCAGRVELYYDGTWQPACTDQWGMSEAQTVCHMLNCGEPISAPSANCLEYGPCQSYCPSNGGNGPTSSQCEEAATICADALTTTDCPPDTTPYYSTPEFSTDTTPYYSTPEFSTDTTPYYSTPEFSTVDSCDYILSQPYGNFSSPNYAGSYPNNARCRWQIDAKKNFCIKVVISEMNLEPSNNCSYESVAVYDGLLSTSPLLGMICTDSVYSFTSTSNGMSVLLTSDGGFANPGFYAYYYSYRCNTSDAVYFTCSSHDMEAVIPNAYLQSLGYSASDVSLNYLGCDPEVTPLFLIFKIPYNGCGTVTQLKNSTVTYSNRLSASPSAVLINRQKNLKVDLHCQMFQDAIVEFTYVADDTIEISETEYGRYDVNLSFYRSSFFYQPIIRSPYQVSLNQELYLQAILHSSDPDLQVFVDTCEASPYEDYFTTQTYDIIRNGCVRDSTYQTYESPSIDRARFSFQAFDFLRHYPNVYLRCKLVVCSINDNSSRCRQGCLMRRKRSPRPIRTKRSPTPYHQELEVVVGPIQLLE